MENSEIMLNEDQRKTLEKFTNTGVQSARLIRRGKSDISVRPFKQKRTFANNENMRKREIEPPIVECDQERFFRERKHRSIFNKEATIRTTS